MRSLERYLVNRLVAVLPPTRFYRLKTALWRWAAVKVSPSARIVSSVRFWTSGPIQIGEDTFLGHEVAVVGGDASVFIGARCDLAPRVMIVTGSHTDGGPTRAAGPGVSKPVVIRDGVWVGAGAILLGGIEIGEGAMIAAGSVVTTSVPPYDVVAGVPARRLRSRAAQAGSSQPSE